MLIEFPSYQIFWDYFWCFSSLYVYYIRIIFVFLISLVFSTTIHIFGTFWSRIILDCVCFEKIHNYFFNPIEVGPFWGCSQMRGVGLSHQDISHVSHNDKNCLFWVLEDCSNKHGYNFENSYSRGILEQRLCRHNFCPWRHWQNFIPWLKYILDLVMWPKFGNSRITRREVILTSNS